MTSFPDSFLKGVPNQDFLTPDDTPTAHLIFEESRDDQGRLDGCLESSINWHDDVGALEKLFDQKKNDQLHFKKGAVVMCRRQLDTITKLPAIKGRLSYERAALTQNAYHGNLLLVKGLPKPVRNQIASTIAMSCFLEYRPHPDER